MKSLVFSIIALGAIVSSVALANKEVGNGGDGVVVGDRVYLFDLYESYNHLKPSLSNVEPSKEILQNVSERFQVNRNIITANYESGATDYDYDKLMLELAKKLTEIKKTDLLFGYSLERSVLAHSWSFVPYQLNDIKDDDGSDIEMPGELVQVAVRSYRSIKFDNSLVKKMDLANLVATIVHESVYALITPALMTEVIDGKKVEYYQQESRRAREVVNYLFSGPLSFNLMRSIVSGSMPIGAAMGLVVAYNSDEFVLYNFRSSGSFNFLDKKQVRTELMQQCADVHGNQVNEFALFSYAITSYGFYPYKDKNQVDKYHFSATNTFRSAAFEVRFSNRSSKEQCLDKMLIEFEKFTAGGRVIR